MDTVEILLKDHPVQDTRRPAKNITSTLVHEVLKSCGLPTLQYITTGWVAIQHPVINFNMLQFTGFKHFQGYI